MEAKVESKAKLFGHPIHPMLIVFPLGLLATAVIMDLIYLFTGNEALATVSDVRAACATPWAVAGTAMKQRTNAANTRSRVMRSPR